MYVCMYVCMYYVPITRLIGTYYYFLLNTDDIKYTIKTHQDFKFMYVCMYVCMYLSNIAQELLTPIRSYELIRI
jgi:hypothetical protein